MPCCFSTNGTGGGAQTLATIQSTLALAPGKGVVLTQAVILPAGQFGQRYLGVRVDSAGEEVEEIETNNVAMTDRATEILAPDLILANLAAPAPAYFGETLPSSWGVTNGGTGSALSTWNDRLYLSPNESGIAGAILLETLSASDHNPLLAGASYTRTVSVTLPLSTNLHAGTWFFVAVTDYGNAQAEISETNNLRSKPVQLTFPPMPDLAIAQLQAPTRGGSGKSVELTWVVTNRGDATAFPPWIETVLASNAVLGVRPLTEFSRTNAIQAGGFLTRTEAISLPLNTVAGDLVFLVTADSRFDVAESDESNNASAATNVTVIPNQLSLLLPANELAEGTSQTALVHRNSDTAKALDVLITTSDETELSVTNLLTIPAGQTTASFELRALRDGLVDGSQWVHLVAVAEGHEGDTQTITVLDVDVPHLSLSLESPVVSEGFMASATVTRDFGTNEPLSVDIHFAGSAQLSTAPVVLIPAGSWSQGFSILSLDDTLVQGPRIDTLGYCERHGNPPVLRNPSLGSG
jgi:hypothetical protein